ncbi:hypothetical protein GE09DRAFT_1148706 [Coniochaeta sp. 2T2.1]|nr:hypothetical protein GE09DRAFT_1148706 [Coniochaeta sp. 2T2.1]
MSRLFRRPSTKTVQHGEDLNSALSSLLTPVSSSHITAQEPEPSKPSHRRTKSTPGVLNTQYQLPSRPWLSLVVAERHRSQSGDGRRRLVKDPGPGSARPSFSHELAEHAHSGEGKDNKEDGNDKGGRVRRGVERIRELYRRDKG